MTEYSRQRELVLVKEGSARSSSLAEELDRSLDSAMTSFDLIRRGQVAVGGTTSIILGRSLRTLRSIVKRALPGRTVRPRR